MLRITELLETQQTIRIRLDGTVSPEAVAELAKTCARHQEQSQKSIVLDLAGVDFMKDEAARQLVDLQSGSITIINCSPFIAILLETVKALDH
jgi:anti-anti-sigma regulatory factor